MTIDCAIIGGGPAGLNAALVLGRARKNVILFDDNQPRNAVTHESHGFLTRDGINPQELRQIAHQELTQYPSVEVRHVRVADVQHDGEIFELVTDYQEKIQAKTIILATGQKEKLPAIEGIHSYYGKSLFSCPYCDGWERRDRPLVVISEGGNTFHFAKIVWNWSRDLLICTNGQQVLTPEQQETLSKNGIQVVEDRISALVGKDGQLERIEFATHDPIAREGGFVATHLRQAVPFATQLGCEMTEHGGIVTDILGRTTVRGVYAAGDTTLGEPAQLIIAAAAGSKAAAGVNTDLIERDFA